MYINEMYQTKKITWENPTLKEIVSDFFTQTSKTNNHSLYSNDANKDKVQVNLKLKYSKWIPQNECLVEQLTVETSLLMSNNSEIIMVWNCVCVCFA